MDLPIGLSAVKMHDISLCAGQTARYADRSIPAQIARGLCNLQAVVTALGLAAGLILAPNLLAQPRIVSTDALVTEVLIALDADNSLVGVDITSQLPQSYRPLPRVGYHRALSAEGVLALNPELLLGSEHVGPPPVLAALRRAGVNIVQLTAPTSIAQLKSNVKRLAKITGQVGNSKAILRRLSREERALKKQALTGQRVAFLLASANGKMRLAGRGTAGDAFISLLGAENCADFEAYRTMSAESLLQLNPDLLLLVEREGNEIDQFLALNPALAHSKASRNDRILSLDGSALVAGISLAAVAEAGRLLQQLHSNITP